jgi:hypothetical protein
MAEQRMFYTLDAELRFRGVGQRALATWGKTERELLGRNIIDVFPRMEGGAVHQALLDALRSMRPVRLEARSVPLGVPIRVEVYPVHGGLQVSFEPLHPSK